MFKSSFSQDIFVGRKLYFLAILLLCGIIENSLAQGCAMCGTALSANDPVTLGFNWSIAFLMAMPYVVFGVLGGWLAYVHRRHLNHQAIS